MILLYNSRIDSKNQCFLVCIQQKLHFIDKILNNRPECVRETQLWGFVIIWIPIIALYASHSDLTRTLRLAC